MLTTAKQPTACERRFFLTTNPRRTENYQDLLQKSHFACDHGFAEPPAVNGFLQSSLGNSAPAHMGGPVI